MDPQILHFKNERQLRRHAVKFLKDQLHQSSENEQAQGIMLSGGSTPKAIYRSLGRKRIRRNNALRLFLSDERMVPSDSPDSNALLVQNLARKLSFLSVKTGQTPEEAAIQFHHDLARELELGMHIDLGLLGLGADGHTAGIFTNELAGSATAYYACAVERADGLHGVSVTPALLQRVKKIIFIVVGETKKDMLTTLLNDPQTIPAGIALKDHPDIEIWTDQPVEKETLQILR
jgi:6-phosphogluconolactonase